MDKINLNTATEEELMKAGLTRIKAYHVVKRRLLKGKFREVEDLKMVPGIGKVTYDRISEMVYVEKPEREVNMEVLNKQGKWEPYENNPEDGLWLYARVEVRNFSLGYPACVMMSESEYDDACLKRGREIALKDTKKIAKMLQKDTDREFVLQDWDKNFSLYLLDRGFYERERKLEREIREEIRLMKEKEV